MFTVTRPVWDALMEALPEHEAKELKESVYDTSSSGAFGRGEAFAAKASAMLHCVVGIRTDYEAALNHTSMMVVPSNNGFGMLIPTDWNLAYDAYVIPSTCRLSYMLGDKRAELPVIVRADQPELHVTGSGKGRLAAEVQSSEHHHQLPTFHWYV